MQNEVVDSLANAKTKLSDMQTQITPRGRWSKRSRRWCRDGGPHARARVALIDGQLKKVALMQAQSARPAAFGGKYAVRVAEESAAANAGGGDTKSQASIEPPFEALRQRP